MTAPNPGSNEALSLGCTCPVMDNGHGRGNMGQPHVFVYSVGCPVHDVQTTTPAPMTETGADDGETE